mgnify:CR=1 FL=1
MSNTPDIRNGRITIRLSLEMSAKLKRGAEEHRMDVSEYARWILGKELEKIQLTVEDTQWIAKQIEFNKAQRRKKNGN